MKNCTKKPDNGRNVVDENENILSYGSRAYDDNRKTALATDHQSKADVDSNMHSGNRRTAEWHDAHTSDQQNSYVAPPRNKFKNPRKQDSLKDILSGAFFVCGSHIPVLLDLDLSAALSRHILDCGSQNTAITAFGHQLADWDDGEPIDNSQSSLDITGKFILFDQHILCMLNVDFAITLGTHILENGSDEACIVEFGERLVALGDQ